MLIYRLGLFPFSLRKNKSIEEVLFSSVVVLAILSSKSVLAQAPKKKLC
jgi:hypothetical protein